MSDDGDHDRDHDSIPHAERGLFGAADALSSAMRATTERELPSFDGATEWLNSEPLTPARLRGHVVLVNFWTYTCINWLHTLPYVRAWAQAYKDQGVVVIGVHTPEFPFEHDIENVRRAAKDMRVDYPIAIDNEYAIWDAFDNHYWPALYVADATGHIRHHAFGEGAYDQSEAVIQHLLSEAGAGGVPQRLVSDRVTVDPRSIEAPANWSDVESGETYLGFARAENFASPGDLLVGERAEYTAPARLNLNSWALSGDWTVGKQAAMLNAANGRIVMRFHARDLHLVMGPAARGTPVRFRVLLNGHPPGAAHGSDVDEHGHGILREPRLYQLIRQPQPITDRQFEIEFLDAGAEAFAFTFG